MSKSIANHQNLSLYSKSDLSNIRKCVILFFSRLKEENCGSLSRILVSTEKTRRHHCATSNPRRKNGKESVNAPITGGIFIFFSLWQIVERNTCYSLFIIACHPIPPKNTRTAQRFRTIWRLEKDGFEIDSDFTLFAL